MSLSWCRPSEDPLTVLSVCQREGADGCDVPRGSYQISMGGTQKRSRRDKIRRECVTRNRWTQCRWRKLIDGADDHYDVCAMSKRQPVASLVVPSYSTFWTRAGATPY